MRHFLSSKSLVRQRLTRVLMAAGLAAGLGFWGAASGHAATVVPAFIASCNFSHRAAVDPIVMPGMVGMSHLHDFFANSGTDENSTAASLRSSGTSSCTATQDRSGYWAPTLTLNGAHVQPTRMRVYYRAGTKNPSTVKTMPAGLMMVAGNSKATALQSTSVVSWGCGQASTGTATIPTCSSTTLVLHVYFPDCWNGRDLDSADHKMHMAYTHNGACPAGYPVPVPKITEDVQYPIRGGSGVTYDFSGTSMTAHADFMNGWSQTTLNALVTKCIDGRVACGVITN
jgi:Domain of unknown function (DUF1996)